MPPRGYGLSKRIEAETGKTLGEFLHQLYWEEGCSQREICNRLNIATSYMSRLFKRYNIPKRPTGHWNINSGKVIGTAKIENDVHNITGRWKKNGYVMLVIKTHPHSCETHGVIFEHRVVVEESLGRYLTEDEIIHHKNEIKDDNRLENLEVTNRAKHTIYHHVGVKRSEETKRRISEKAKKRLENKKIHPSYKDVDNELRTLVEKGYKPTEISKLLNICRKTIYNKIDYLGLREMYKNA